MSKKVITDQLKNLAPILLTGMGAGGVIGTIYTCSKDSVKAHKVLSEHPELKTRKEQLKGTWKCYIPTIISGTLTIVCIVGAGYLSHKKQMALAAALALNKDNMQKFEAKAKDILGEDKVKEIKKEVASEKVAESKATPPEKIKGDILVYEPYTDQYIDTTRERIVAAALEVNRRLTKDFSVSFNTFLKLIGGKQYPLGDDIGWNMENELQDYNWGYYGGVPWIEILTSYQEINGKEVAVLYYEVGPEEQKPEDMIWYEGGKGSYVDDKKGYKEWADRHFGK